MLYVTRPPITEEEAAVLKKLADVVDASRGNYCTGTFSPQVESPCIFYSFQSSNLEFRLCDLEKATEKDLEELHFQCAPSSFGRREELIPDEPDRLAKELPTSRFNLNFDPLANQHGIAAAISAFVEDVPGVEVRMCKLNSYGVGGHSKPHLDAPKGDNHIGTLLIGLPIHYTGGQLLLCDRMKHTATIDWSTEGRHDGSGHPWIFFSLGTKQEILPVTSGYRLSLAFDVFSTHDVRYQTHVSKFNIDVESSTIYKELTAALKNKEFLTGGGRLAFGFSHEYPPSEMEADLLSILKGSDMIIWRAFHALGLKIEVRAAYEPIDIDETPLNEDQEDGSDSDGEGRFDRYPADNFSYYLEGQVMLTSESFEGVYEDSCLYPYPEGEDTIYSSLENNADAGIERDLIWVQRPLHFSKGAPFVWKSESPSVLYSYVAGTLIATIPAAGLNGRI